MDVDFLEHNYVLAIARSSKSIAQLFAVPLSLHCFLRWHGKVETTGRKQRFAPLQSGVAFSPGDESKAESNLFVAHFI